jgi:hypothetical protein
MGNIATARVSIRGTRPILWHRFGPDALPLEKKERTGVAGNDPEEWKRTVLMTKDKQLYLEPSYAFGCLRDAAKHTKKGKGSIQSLVAATLQIMDDRILVDRFVPDNIYPDLINTVDEPVYLDVRGVVNKATKGRNVRYRVAASVGWSCSFTIVWDVTIVSRGEMQAVIHDAGRLVGLGDGRGIGFGRFVVESFEIEEEKAKRGA